MCCCRSWGLFELGFHRSIRSTTCPLPLVSRPVESMELMEWRQQTSVSCADAFVEAQRWIQVPASPLITQPFCFLSILRRCLFVILFNYTTGKKLGSNSSTTPGFELNKSFQPWNKSPARPLLFVVIRAATNYDFFFFSKSINLSIYFPRLIG